jgi:hypothetical protein
MDINIIANSFYHYFFSFCIWLVAFIANKQQISYSKKGFSYTKLAIYMTIFSTFGFIGNDYSGYKYLYDAMLYTKENIHVEPFYYWLVKVFPSDYTLWRFIVWGAASTTYVLALKKLKLNPPFSSFIIIVVLLYSTFYYLRNSLGFSVLCLGIAYLLSNRSKNKILIGIILITLSLYLHKSMIIYVVIFFLSLIIPFSKKYIVLSLILFPILYPSITIFSSLFLEQSFLNQDTSNYGQLYIDSESHLSPTLFGWIDLLITKGPIILLLFYSIKHVYFKKEIEKNYLLQYSYTLFYVSMLFLGQNVSYTLSDRVWIGAMFPFTLFLCQYFNNKREHKIFKYSMSLLILANFYSFLSKIINVL